MKTYTDVVRRRIRIQGLAQSRFTQPVDVVSWLGAVQSQDYAGATWALGLRVPGLVASDADRAFNAGQILRTHLLRPTWHFVTPADIRWVLALSAPRVHQCNAFVYRASELNAPVLAKSRRVLERALRDRQFLTRVELQTRLARAGIVVSGIRLAYVMMHAELEGVIVSGPRRGKQFTYALLDERVPSARVAKPGEALEALTRRYFTGHGPATVRDFAWWSGLTMAQARRGLDMVKTDFERAEIDEREYWFAPAGSKDRGPQPAAALLLPNYDECLIAYRDRGAPRDGRTTRLVSTEPLPHHLLIGATLAGSWGRSVSRTEARVDVAPYAPLRATEAARVGRAARTYGEFLGLPASLVLRKAIL